MKTSGRYLVGATLILVLCASCLSLDEGGYESTDDRSSAGSITYEDEIRLLEAAKRGDSDEVAELLDKGVSTEVVDDYFKTPLILAAGNGHLQAVQLLIDRGADLYARDDIDGTALLWAIAGDHPLVSQYLLDQGESLNTTTAPGRYNRDEWPGESGHTICGAYNVVDTMAVVLRNGFDPAVTNSEGGTALNHAAWLGYIDTAKLLLYMGANPNYEDDYGTDPRTAALENGHQEILSLLNDPERTGSTRGIEYDLASRLIATEIAVTLMYSEGKRTAVADFVGLDGVVSQLGRFVGEEVVRWLGRDKMRTLVVERRLLDQALDETQFTINELNLQTGDITSIGQFLPAEYLVTGSLVPLDEFYRLQVRVFSVQSGEIVATISHNIIRTQSLDEMLKQEL